MMNKLLILLSLLFTFTAVAAPWSDEELAAAQARALQVLEKAPGVCVGSFAKRPEVDQLLGFLTLAIKSDWPKSDEIGDLNDDQRKALGKGLFTDKGHLHSKRVTGIYLAQEDRFYLDSTLKSTKPDDAFFILVHETLHRTFHKSQLRQTLAQLTLSDLMAFDELKALYKKAEMPQSLSKYKQLYILSPALLNETLVILATNCLFEKAKTAEPETQWARTAPITSAWSKSLEKRRTGVGWADPTLATHLVQMNYAPKFKRSFVNSGCVGYKRPGFGGDLHLMFKCGFEYYWHANGNQTVSLAGNILYGTLNTYPHPKWMIPNDFEMQLPSASASDMAYLTLMNDSPLLARPSEMAKLNSSVGPDLKATIASVLHKYLPQSLRPPKRPIDSEPAPSGDERPIGAEGVHPDLDLIGTSFPFLENGIKDE